MVKGRTQLDCVIRAADALKTSENVQVSGISTQVSGIRTPQELLNGLTLTSSPNVVLPDQIISFAKPIVVLWLNNLIEVWTFIRINGDDANLAKSLTTQYLSIISEIRESLARSVKHPNLYTEQKDRVSQMLGGIVKAHTDAKNAGKIFTLIPSLNSDFLAIDDKTDQQVKPIADVFKECATEAAKSMI